MICLFDISKRNVLVSETRLWVPLALQCQCFLRTGMDTGQAILARARELGMCVRHTEVAMRDF